jgi:phenylalanyl-tRNA synthetase beta chain
LEFPNEIDSKQILSKHPKGKEYSQIVEGWSKLPVFVDDKGVIMSMPPIINSHDVGKIDSTTKDIFVEVTGTDSNVLKNALNIVISSLSGMDGKVYSIDCIQQNKKKEVIPNFTPELIKISLINVNKLLGLNLNENQMKNLIEKMGYGYSKGVVSVPAYRTDIIHEVDLIEDIAIAYGYENFSPEIPEISTIGQESSKEIIKRRISEIFSGIGMLEVLNYHLTNKKNQFEKMGLQKKDFIELEESKTDYTLLRKDLSHCLLKTLSDNIDSEYPQKIFETGKIFFLKRDEICESESLAAAVSSGNFTIIKQTLDYLFRLIDLKVQIEECEDFPKYFIGGRVAKIVLDGKDLGFIGEIHPRVLRKWKIKMPVALFELNLDEVFKKLVQVA